MVSLEIPADLYTRLESAAREKGLAASEYAARLLDEALEQALLAEIREERKKMKLYVSNEELTAAKNWGRP